MLDVLVLRGRSCSGCSVTSPPSSCSVVAVGSVAAGSAAFVAVVARVAVAFFAAVFFAVDFFAVDFFAVAFLARVFAALRAVVERLSSSSSSATRRSRPLARRSAASMSLVDTRPIRATERSTSPRTRFTSRCRLALLVAIRSSVSVDTWACTEVGTTAPP